MLFIIDKKHEPWPNPTLKRFETFLNSKDILSEMDYLYYCDADMRFANKVGFEILGNRVATIHPGFLGGRGTPETKPISKACVYPNEHMVYY